MVLCPSRGPASRHITHRLAWPVCAWRGVQDTDLRGMRGVFLVGLSFAYMAYRNFVTTVATVLEKQRCVHCYALEP